MSVSVAIIGECMLELTRSNSVSSTASRTMPMTMSYGGDTMNTAIYLSRSGIDVSYVTGLGDDSTSDWLIGQWTKEGVDCSLITRMPNSVPGMYMINVADDGERSFLYWRKNSPASRLFDDSSYSEQLLQSLLEYDYLYLSGISLAILDAEPRERLFELVNSYRKRGGKLVFDGNYRPNLWSSADSARQAYTRMYRITDIALPTLEDEQQLFGFETAQQVSDAVRDLGVSEIIVKMGAKGCMALSDGDIQHIDAKTVTAVDTTAAGDSFNAGYLSARLNGAELGEACRKGHALAAQVIQHRGAIIPA